MGQQEFDKLVSVQPAPAEHPCPLCGEEMQSTALCPELWFCQTGRDAHRHWLVSDPVVGAAWEKHQQKGVVFLADMGATPEEMRGNWNPRLQCALLAVYRAGGGLVKFYTVRGHGGHTNFCVDLQSADVTFPKRHEWRWGFPAAVLPQPTR